MTMYNKYVGKTYSLTESSKLDYYLIRVLPAVPLKRGS